MSISSKNEPFRRLVMNDRFLGHVIEGLLELPPGVRMRAVEYQALRLLAYENGIQLDGRTIVPRADVERQLKEKGIDLETALAPAVERIGKVSIPNAVPRTGDVYQSINSDLLPGQSFAIPKTTIDDLATVQAAGQILTLSGIVPKFTARTDPDKDDKRLFAVQTARNALRENTQIIVTEELVNDTADLLIETGKRLGPKAEQKIMDFISELPAFKPKQPQADGKIPSGAVLQSYRL